MCKEYNGWSNYETWCVNLWLDNDETLYNLVNDFVSDINDDDKDETIYKVEHAIENLIDELNPLSGEANLFSDILSANLSNVNYYEIAEHVVNDYWNENTEE